MASRIKRSKPAKIFAGHNYRDALKYLLRDFNDRCAYSLVHNKDNTATMEVDHFNPTLGGTARNNYKNLMPSIRYCNGKKGKKWPTAEQQRKGLRFIDPTKELDYGAQIFEDPATHKLIGTTPAGRYHILHLDLNAEFLIQRRKERAELAKIMSSPAKYKGDFLEESQRTTLELLAMVRKLLERAIPSIPPPPATC